MDSVALTAAIKQEGYRLGFHAVGITPASSLKAREGELSRWLSNGLAGRLHYMEIFFERQAHLLDRFQDLKGIIVVAVSYASGDSPEAAPQATSGRIARYAQGKDYHRAVGKRLKRLESYLRALVPDHPLRVVRAVDTSPIQERALTERAGLGFIGKNSCLILPRGGSFVFLGALLTNLELVYDQPISWDCGSCSLCLEACPTGALRRPYELDARRCISYLTIEMKGEIDPELKPLLSDWLFGCDICQEVCPYNRRPTRRGVPGVKATPWPEFQREAGAGASLSLEEILRIRTDEEFLSRFAGSPLMLSKREGLLRNACVLAGNLKDPRLIPALTEAFQEDPSALVRQEAAWALGQIPSAMPVG